MKRLGASSRPYDWKARTSGTAQYTADLSFDGLLVARVLRSPHPYAEIVSIDTAAAAMMPGVMAVVTMGDFPKGVRYLHEGGDDRPPLADGVVRYVGQEVAAVAATSAGAAQEALDAIRVSYRKKTPPLTVEAALRENSLRLHPRPLPAHNVSRALDRSWGDPEGARSRATTHVSDRFVFGRQTHACMEPNSVVADWDAVAQRLHLWVSTQAAIYVRDEVAHVMGLAEDRVVCHEVEVGGGFGSKSRVSEHEAIAGALARKSGRPVRLVLDRNEEFEASKSRHPFHIGMSLHADKSGRVIGVEGDIRVENGAYDHSGYSVMSAGLKGLGLIYRPEGIALKSVLVDTAMLPGGQIRGYGTTQVMFALECMMDELATTLSRDPIDLRLENANRAGEETLIGARPESVELVACLQAVRDAIGWDRLRHNRPPGQGVGVACAAHLSGSFADRGEANRSDAAIDIGVDGRIRVRSGTADTGTGQRTLFAQIVADTFDVPVESIEVVTMDTDTTPYDLGAWSSRGTHYTGHAVHLAAEAAAAKLQTLATARLGDAEVTFVDGAAEGGGSRIPIGDLVAFSNEAVDGAISVETSFVEPNVARPDPKTGKGNVSPSYCYAAHAAHVSVDTRTGQVRVLDYVAAHDLGTVLNPVAARGQIVGAAAMGIGAALGEEMIFEQGKLASTGFLHYALPRAADLPNIRSIMVESADPIGPFGAKAVGELGVNPPPAAIANAVFDAIGVRITEIPITPDKILCALRERSGTRRKLTLWRRPERWWIALVRWAYPRGLFRTLHAFRTHGPSRRVPPPLARLDMPDSLDDALAMLTAGSQPLGGGTDLLPRRTQNLAPASRLVSVAELPELRKIEGAEASGPTVIGGAVTLSEIADRAGTLIAEAVATIATPQIRNMATLAGNLVQEKRCWFYRNGFDCYKRAGGLAPCYAILGDHRFYHAAIDGHRCQAVTPSDIATVLVALDAAVDIVGPDGKRMVQIGEFYTGPGETVLRPDELIRSVHFDEGGPQRRSAFEKLRLWEGDFAVVSVALAADIGEDGVWRDIRITCGGIAPVPWRATATERALAGTPVDAASLRRAIDDELDRHAHPLPRNVWKLDAIAGLAEKACERLLSR